MGFITASYRLRCWRRSARAASSRPILWRSTAAASSTPQRQRALSRYYIDAGASGLAVGVHTTQFQIRAAGLYEPVLQIAAETAGRMDRPPAGDDRGPGRAHRAGAARGRPRAGPRLPRRPAQPRRAQGCWRGRADRALRRASPRRIPLVGFYLQPAVGGIVLGTSFWRRFAALDNVIAIKVAPFDRYRTLDVVRGVVEAGAEERVTLLTGNDDHIVARSADAVPLPTRRRATVTVHFAGGLLGHWSRLDQARGRAGRADQGRAARGRLRPGPARARRRGHRLQRRLLRRGERLQGLHRGRATRSCAARACSRASGASIPTRRPEPRPGGGDRPRARRLARTQRRRLRRRQPRRAGWRERPAARSRSADLRCSRGYR